MKALLIVIILAVGGYFAYTTWFAAPAETTDGEQPVDSDSPFDTVVTTDDDGDDAGAADGAARGGSGGSSGALPEAAAQALAAADAKWDELVAAGTDPVTHIDAVAMARQYSQVLRATYNEPALESLAQKLIDTKLNPLGTAIFFSPTPYPAEPTGLVTTHTVKSGEILNDIGRKYGMSPEMFNLLRNRPIFDSALRAGETLKVINISGDHPAKDWTVGFNYHVDKSDFFMDLSIMGVFVKRFPVGIGTDATPTPVGGSYIEARERTPGQWTMPDGTVVFPGDPRFIIGEYWLRINPQIGAQGIGFHTYTGDGATTGAKVSNGCIRLEQDDMETLYALSVPVGFYESGFITRAPMTVEIVE